MFHKWITAKNEWMKKSYIPKAKRISLSPVTAEFGPLQTPMLQPLSLVCQNIAVSISKSFKEVIKLKRYI